MSHGFINSPFGFATEFDNGWEVSVQWGPGNYCETRQNNIYMGINPFDGTFRRYDSTNAEVRVRYVPTNQMLALQPHEDVDGWVSPNDVVQLMSVVAALPKRYLRQLPCSWKKEYASN